MSHCTEGRITCYDARVFTFGFAGEVCVSYYKQPVLFCPKTNAMKGVVCIAINRLPFATAFCGGPRVGVFTTIDLRLFDDHGLR